MATSQAELQTLFQDCAILGADHLQVDGLDRLWQKLGLPVAVSHKKNLRSLFNKIDGDADGKISFDDLLQTLPAILELADSLSAKADASETSDTIGSPMGSPMGTPMGSPMGSPRTPGRSRLQDQMKSVFDGCDTDGDGVLSKSEVESLLLRLDLEPVHGSGTTDRRTSAFTRRESVCGLLSDLKVGDSHIDFPTFMRLMSTALARSEEQQLQPSSTRRGRIPSDRDTDSPASRRSEFLREEMERCKVQLQEKADEATQLQSLLKKATKDHQTYMEVAQEQLDQAEQAMKSTKSAAAARLKSELRSVRQQADDEIMMLRNRLEEQSAGSHSSGRDEASAALLASLKEDRAQLQRENDSLHQQVLVLEDDAILMRQDSENSMGLLAIDLESYREAGETAQDEADRLSAKVLIVEEDNRRLQDLNDELRHSRPASRSTADDGLEGAGRSLEDELSSGAKKASELDAALARVVDLEAANMLLQTQVDQYKSVQGELSEFAKLNASLSQIQKDLETERAYRDRIVAENEALKHMYKQLKANSTSPARTTKLRRMNEALKTNYEDIKVYVQGLEQSKGMLDLRIHTLELELADSRSAPRDAADDASLPQSPTSPTAGSPLPANSPPSEYLNRTLQTMVDVQQSRMAESEAGKEMVKWKLSVVEKELERQKIEASSLTKRLAASEESNRSAVAQLAVASGLGSITEAADTEDKGGGSALDSSQQSAEGSTAEVPADTTLTEVEAENLSLLEQNSKLTEKVDRLQVRLQQLQGRDPKSESKAQGTVLEDLKKLIAEYPTEKKAARGSPLVIRRSNADISRRGAAPEMPRRSSNASVDAQGRPTSPRKQKRASSHSAHRLSRDSGSSSAKFSSGASDGRRASASKRRSKDGTSSSDRRRLIRNVIQQIDGTPKGKSSAGSTSATAQAGTIV